MKLIKFYETPFYVNVNDIISTLQEELSKICKGVSFYNTYKKNVDGQDTLYSVTHNYRHDEEYVLSNDPKAIFLYDAIGNLEQYLRAENGFV